ncbi:hypothetical protein ACFOHQ_05040 [Xanthomonas fragariae]
MKKTLRATAAFFVSHAEEFMRSSAVFVSLRSRSMRCAALDPKRLNHWCIDSGA